IGAFDGKYVHAHYIESDAIIDVEKHLHNFNKYKSQKKLIGYEYVAPLYRNGIFMEIVSFDISWLNRNLKRIEDWSEYFDEGNLISNTIGRQRELILEHWLYDYFEAYNLLDSVLLLSADDRTKVFSGSYSDRSLNEPAIRTLLAETDEHKLVLFIINDGTKDDKTSEFKAFHNNVLLGESQIKPDNVCWFLIEKNGVVEVDIDGKNNVFHIDKDKLYTDTFFTFHDKSIKCYVSNKYK
ncbi:unnamed protein product, partial [marine sediment metagenome]